MKQMFNSLAKFIGEQYQDGYEYADFKAMTVGSQILLCSVSTAFLYMPILTEATPEATPEATADVLPILVMFGLVAGSALKHIVLKMLEDDEPCHSRERYAADNKKHNVPLMRHVAAGVGTYLLLTQSPELAPHSVWGLAIAVALGCASFTTLPQLAGMTLKAVEKRQPSLH